MKGMEDVYNKKIKSAARACIKYMEEGDVTTFVNLEQVMAENGIAIKDNPARSLSYSLEGHKNIILWVFSGVEATQVFQEIYLLLKADNKKILFKSCAACVYLIDGEMLTFPLATALNKYLMPHWLPVVLSIQEVR